MKIVTSKSRTASTKRNSNDTRAVALKPIRIEGCPRPPNKMILTCMDPKDSLPGLPRQLHLHDGQLYLGDSCKGTDYYILKPCTFRQAVAWCKAIDAVSPQDGTAERFLLEYAVARFIPFSNEEVNAINEAARVNHDGDAVEFVRSWTKENCRAEVESVKGKRS
jgi:hypothetical protein